MSIFNKHPYRPEEEYEDDRYEEKAAPAPKKAEGRPSDVSLGGNGMELKVVRPERFEDAAGIADHLLAGCTVVLNLEATDKDVSRRLIDFLSGVAYSLSGGIKRVANSTFVITGRNVDVSDDEMGDED